MRGIIVVSNDKEVVDRIHHTVVKLDETLNILHINDEEICFTLVTEISPDFILIDLTFLKERTKWFCNQISSILSIQGAPIIAICNQQCSIETKSAALENGVNFFIRKDFDFIELSSVFAATKCFYASYNAIDNNEPRYQKNYKPTGHGYALHNVIRESSGENYQYKVATANSTFEKIVGKELQHFHGQNFIEILPSFETKHLKELDKVVNTRQPVHIQNFNESGNKIYDVYAYSANYNQVATIIKFAPSTLGDDKRFLGETNIGDFMTNNFISNFTNEIRTPMNIILGFSEILDSKPINEDKKHFYLSQIKQKGYYLMEMIDKFSDLSRIHSQQFELCVKLTDINLIFTDLISIFDQKLNNLDRPKRIYFRINEKVKNRKLLVETDPFRLIQVFTELISNALKQTDRGYIEIGYTIRQAIDKECFEGSCIEFYVKDTGKGSEQKTSIELIEEHKNKKSQDLSLASSLENSLGLNITHKLVECLGGTIWAETEPDKGTVFYFTIPFK